MKKETNEILKTGRSISNGFLTPKCRVMFHNIFNPQDSFKTGKRAYDITVTFDKDTTDMTLFTQWIFEEIKKTYPTGTPKGFKMPVKDSDIVESTYDTFKNTWSLRSTTQAAFPPEIRDAFGKIVTEESNEIYSGCYVRLIISPYVFDRAGNKGLSLQLKAVQKVGDGPRLGQKINIDEAFEVLEPINGSIAEEVVNPFTALA